MRRPFPLRDAPGGKNREGAKKNGYGRTNNSDAVQGEKNSSPEPYPEAAYGLRKKARAQVQTPVNQPSEPCMVVALTPEPVPAQGRDIARVSDNIYTTHKPVISTVGSLLTA